jgi:DNA-binding NarL/FixJ family response regulator
MVVDDHQTFAHALSLALSQLDGVASCEPVSSVEAVLAELEHQPPDVVVLGAYLDERKGVDGAAGIRRHWPDTRVVMLTGQPDLDLLADAAAAGVDAFLSKETSFDELRSAVVADEPTDLGDSRLLAMAADAIRRRELARSTKAPVDLTPREREVLSLLAQGVALKDMARLLGIKLETCRGYVKSLLLKLDARSQLQAVVIAAREGLLDEDEPLGGRRPA